MTTAAPVLATRFVARSRAWAALAVIGFAGLTALAAQFSFRVPPIEVPFTLQTGVVLLSGGVLGAKLGASSQLLYLAVGALGAPVFAEASSGLGVLTRATGGYLVGFIVASFLTGRLAEARQDRQILSGMAAFIVGSLVIYAFGVAGLMVNLQMDFGTAIVNGVVPFVFWDLLKAIVAGSILPAAWKLSGD